MTHHSRLISVATQQAWGSPPSEQIIGEKCGVGLRLGKGRWDYRTYLTIDVVYGSRAIFLALLMATVNWR